MEGEHLGLGNWPDGSFGIQRQNDLYTFFAAGGGYKLAAGGTTRGLGGGINRTTGSLDNPISESVQPGIAIQNLKDTYDYAGGGHFYRDPGTGNLLMFYHAEKWPGGDPTKFYSLLGLALSADGGSTWNDLGAIITPEVQFGGAAMPADMGGAPFVVVGDYLHVYFSDTLASGQRNFLAVARAPLNDAIKAANAGKVVGWTKYYQGAWSEPGIGGRSSPLETGNPQSRWLDVAYNGYLGKYLLGVGADTVLGSVGIFLAESTDGLSWSNRALIEGELGESFYTTLVGLGDDPQTLGSQFYAYYSYAPQGRGFLHHSDAFLARRLISYQPGFRKMTVMTLQASASGGQWSAHGTLADAVGSPLVGAPIELSVQLLDGPGQFFKHTVAGIVPGNAKTALVGFRVGTEGVAPGTADLTLYDVSYVDGGTTAERVPNPSFAQGLRGWGFITSQTVNLQPSDRGQGEMMKVGTTPVQTATANSGSFAVTPGSSYTAEFDARVAPLSVGRGYFLVIFNGSSGEVQRTRLPLDPGTPTYTATTDANGAFNVTLTGLPPDRFVLEAKYPGDSNRWPAYQRFISS